MTAQYRRLLVIGFSLALMVLGFGLIDWTAGRLILHGKLPPERIEAIPADEAARRLADKPAPGTARLWLATAPTTSAPARPDDAAEDPARARPIDEDALDLAPPRAELYVSPPNQTASGNAIVRVETPTKVAQAPDEPERPALDLIARGTRLSAAFDGSLGPRPPKAPAESLIERSHHGGLPRISADGERPREAYARLPAPNPPHAKPPSGAIALVVTGLGLDASLTTAALDRLPPDVTVGLSAYARGLDRLAERARASGREFLLTVPMEPFDYPNIDPGPDTLLVDLDAKDSIRRLHRLMGQAQGYVGITHSHGARFLADGAALAPAMAEINRRGLLFLAASRPAMTGEAPPPVVATIAADRTAAGQAIAAALAKAETQALQTGFAIVVIEIRPSSLDPLVDWADGLATKGLRLLPLSSAAARDTASTASLGPDFGPMSR